MADEDKMTWEHFGVVPSEHECERLDAERRARNLQRCLQLNYKLAKSSSVLSREWAAEGIAYWTRDEKPRH